MNPPNREIYRQRMQEIGRAIMHTKQAGSITFSMFLGHALNNLRLARLEVYVDYRKRLDIWNEDQEEQKRGA